QKFADRKFHQHNPTITLMRTTVEENAQLGAEIGRKLAAARGPAVFLFPTRGVSAIDAAGQSFDDPESRRALLEAIRTHRGSVELVELDNHINDPAFAEAAAKRLIQLIESGRKTASQ
ncbi:MAG TPA: Tm-1-like ATP-binding domain-containing protein, partial [Burkholderiaceae bacterium]|nr:Tm-1-like ATP-binding domain-containing protein [Burkholderiaceae bacterium]